MVEKGSLPITTEPADFETSRGFDLAKLLAIEPETIRVACGFDDIQEYMHCEVNHIIPKALADQLQSVVNWQLVNSTPKRNISAVLFVGHTDQKKESIHIQEAQATIVIDRRKANDDGKYGYWLDSVDIAGIFPDSNKYKRIVAVSYRTWDEYDAWHINASVSDQEFPDEPEDHSIIGILTAPTWPIPSFADYYPINAGLITQGMIDVLPVTHKKVIKICPEPNVTFLSPDGSTDNLPGFHEGLWVARVGSTYLVGFSSDNNTNTWSVSIPVTLDKIA